MSRLDEYRARVRQIDELILTMVAERMQQASEIGRIKKENGIPLRDFEVERAVLDSAERRASGLGLSAELARSVMRALIDESRARQERETYSSYAGSAERILVIGGRGKMGRWFVDFFQNQGHRVDVFDTAEQQPPGGLGERLSGATFAVIATPLNTVPDVIESVARCGFAGTLFDVASLKGHLKPAIAAALRGGVSITSIHPMFGAEARTLSDQVICLCDCGDAEATERVRAFFADTAASLVDLSLDEHDRIVSCVLGLSHFTSILFTRVLMRNADSFGLLNRVGSTTFHSQMATTATVMRENPALYYEIQRVNPFTNELYESIHDELESLTSAVLSDDRDAFVQMMASGRDWMESR